MVKDNMTIPLRGEYLGQAISENLSLILRKYVTKDDRAEISAQTNVSMHTVAKLIVRDCPLTANNSRVIIEMVKTAIMRCDQVIEEAKLAKIELEAILVTEDNTENDE